eukprot:262052-Lingulodinium_polyedra.AAC.1
MFLASGCRCCGRRGPPGLGKDVAWRIRATRGRQLLRLRRGLAVASPVTPDVGTKVELDLTPVKGEAARARA